MRRGNIAVHKIVVWVLAIVVLLVVLIFMIYQLNPNNEGSIIWNLLNKTGETIKRTG